MTTDRTSCAACDQPVVIGDLLDGPPRHIERHPVVLDGLPVLIDPAQPDETLLLHLGVSTDRDRWLLVSLADDAGRRACGAMPLPHGHRLHVCATVPTSWTVAVDLPVQLQASGTYS